MIHFVPCGVCDLSPPTTVMINLSYLLFPSTLIDPPMMTDIFFK